ncbi:MAG: DivIVA domain-containing protein [Chlamydiia bacterium]|nr:DivIVA domain-containing protein [Chlamydiia bacterium]
MENLETGKDKIKKICEILRTETLEPAKEEAQKVIEMAQAEAQNIIRQAEQQGKKIYSQTMEKLEKEKALFRSSLQTGVGNSQARH